MEFMPQMAPLVVLLFLGTCFGLAVTGLAFLYGLVRRKSWLTKYSLAVGVVGVGLYFTLLLAAALTSREKVLRPGEQKYFCEIDCHVAYSVVDVATTKALGAPPQQATATGTFYVVKVKSWFDQRTISSRRPLNASLRPNPRRVVVVDEQGREYQPSPAGLVALEQVQGKTTLLTQPLRPGESYTTDLVFDLPAGVQNPRLLITDADRISALLVGHENSFFHKKILFVLAPSSRPAPGAAFSGQQPREFAALRVHRAG